MTSTTWVQNAGMDSGTDSDTVLTYAEAAQSSATQSQNARDTANLHKLAAEAAATSATSTAAALTGFDLEAIAATKAVTAVDVFVYDTSKDSDGGAWRKRTQGTSWYNDTMNTSTRGSRKEFPAVAVIVAEADTVTIYDGDDPSLPMWMVANRFSGSGYSWIGFNTTSTAKAVSMLNGVLCVGSTDSASNFRPGLAVIDFGADSAVLILEPADPKDLKTISERNVGANLAKLNDVRRLVNSYVRDVSMTVLPDAPIDSATGLPVPTIAAATDGGVSVIKDDGTVVNRSDAKGATGGQFLTSNNYYYSNKSPYNLAQFVMLTPDFTSAVQVSATTEDGVYRQFVQANDGKTAPLNRANGLASGGSGTVGGSIKGLKVWDFGVNQTKSSLTMAVELTSTYNTGWMNGDVKGAFLSDTDDTDLVGGTDNDRSVNANPLTVNGTVIRTPVATGADLVGYSGWNDTNYLYQPPNADLDFGIGDFSIMVWGKQAAASPQNRYIVRKGPTLEGWRFYMAWGTGLLYFNARDGVNNALVSSSATVDNKGFVQMAVCRRAGVLELYVNGELSGTLDSAASAAVDMSHMTASDLLVGIRDVGESNEAWANELALLRFSATAPTAEQIAKIYNDEKVLFQENAQATLYGTSNAVTALAHDSDTNLLHVGTSAGRSVFDGLRRIDNTTDAVTTAISASGGFILEQ